MDPLANVVAQRPVTLHRAKNVTLLIRSVTSVTDRPIRPTSRTVAGRPTFGITYPLTDRPDGPPLARDRYPPLGNTVGRLSLAQGRPSRPYMRTRTCTRQRPTRRSGRTRHSTPRDGARTHTYVAYGSRAALSAAQHAANVPTLLPAAPHRLRVPRARAAQAAADQAAASQRLGRLGRRRRRTRRELAFARHCRFSSAAFCCRYLCHENERVDSSTTIGSRRKVVL